jgi:hypothetical protein
MFAGGMSCKISIFETSARLKTGAAVELVADDLAAGGSYWMVAWCLFAGREIEAVR